MSALSSPRKHHVESVGALLGSGDVRVDPVLVSRHYGSRESVSIPISALGSLDLSADSSTVIRPVHSSILGEKYCFEVRRGPAAPPLPAAAALTSLCCSAGHQL